MKRIQKFQKLLLFYLANNTLNQLCVIGCKTKEIPDFVYSFFCARIYNTWENSELFINEELKVNIFNNEKFKSEPVTKSRGITEFPVTVWITYEYLTNSVAGGKADVESRIYNACYTAFEYARSRCAGVSYRLPGLRYSVDIFPGISDDFLAQEVVLFFLQEAKNVFLSYPFIRSIHYEYHWSPIADEEGRVPTGSSGGWSESEGKICPKCNRLSYRCICGVELRVTIQGNTTKELLEPYEITVSIKGANKDKVDIIDVQMKKETGNWRSLSYGTPMNGEYKITRSSFNPGKWKIQAGYGLVGESEMTYSSNVVTVTEQWPHIDAFKDDRRIKECLETLWGKAVDFARQNQRDYAVREYGAFIFLNSRGTYSCKEVEPGPIVYLNTEGVAGSLTLVEGDYANLDDWDNPKRQTPLVVGTMHTHYPLTWAKRGVERPVGPSKQDKDASQVWPGLVYDYSFEVKAGDPEENSENPLRIWTYGPERRAISK